MSPTITIVLWTITVIVGHGLPMLVWWLRLRWQLQQELARQQYLVAIAHALPVGGRIIEERSDGTWVRLGMTRGRVE
jgi:hypothetical protein